MRNISNKQIYEIIQTYQATNSILEAAKAIGADEDSIRRAIENFEGIPNRMEYFGTFGGVDYYNDAIATIPEAVLCALREV